MRLLYDGRSREPAATHRFRLAVAYLPPEALRLEIYPPVGGARLIVTGDGSTLVALAPQERRFEALDAKGDGLARLVGVALDARAFVALLLGASPCADREAGTAEAPETCGTATWRFQRVGSQAHEDEAKRVARFIGNQGETLLSVEYGKGKKGAGAWPDEVRLTWPDRAVTVDLLLRQGLADGEGLEPSAFHTEAPPGFVAGPVLEDAAGAPWLLPEGTGSGEPRP
jgi:hypothetical protein